MAAKLRPYGASNNAARACGCTSRMQGQETAQFSHRFTEKNAAEPCAAEAGCPYLGNQVLQTRETEQHMRKAE